MSELFAYICTKSTVDPYVPTTAIDVQHLSRDVSDGFLALSGGYFRVGQLAFFPVQRSVPSHLLCDGREVPKASFPELYQYLGSSQGAPVNPDNFKLPDFIGAASFAPAPTASTETATQGTVDTPEPTPPVGDPEPIHEIYGPVESGGRGERIYVP